MTHVVPVLGSDRVALRPIVPDDAADLLAVVLASREHIAEWMAWATPDYDLEASREFCVRVAGGPDLAWRICEPGSTTTLGVVGLNDPDPLNLTAEVGYWLAASATGRGLAAEAARLVILHGLTDIGLHRVEVVAAVGNLRSRAVAERLGLLDEGIRHAALRSRDQQHDARVYAALRSHVAQLERTG